MKLAKKAVVLWLFFVFCVSMSWSKDKETLLVKLDSQGRTLYVSNNGNRAGKIRIEIDAAREHSYAIVYRFFDHVFDPIPLLEPMTADEAKPAVALEPFDPADCSYEVVVPKGMSFFNYNIIDETASRSVIKVGGVVLGQYQKSIYFDLQDEDDQPLLLSRFGNYPTLTQDDLICAVIINRLKRRNPGRFYLFVEVDNQPVVNPTPVRPVFATREAVAKLAEQLPVFYDADDAYYDVILPFGQKFNGGDVLELTISAYTDVVTSDKVTTGDKHERIKTVERKFVDLIKGVKLPQVRALYRFNVTPGLILSSLRDREYFKVKTQSDDPLTKEINEARFRTDDIRGEWRAFPTLAFTLYLKRVDIQERLSLGEALIPNPTVALALNSLDPSKNMFFGFMHEFPVRNTHLFYGLHVGQTTELVNRNEVDEDRSDTAPLTRQKTELGFFIGLSFNLDWLTSIFK